MLAILRQRTITPPLQPEVVAGMLLIGATVAAMIWANSPWAGSYEALWSLILSVELGSWSLSKPVGIWVNDALMAVFFLLVGLEIKREALAGSLSTRRAAALPIAAAVGGMVVPAALYLAVNSGGGNVRGWGVPMATDIAFALGLLVILGRGAPLALKVLLAAVAVVDDLGAILVIAFAYTPEVGWGALGWGAVFLAGLAGLGHLRVQRPWPYVVLGAALWYALLRSGVHATLAGVLVAFTIPLSTRDADDEPLLHRMEHALHPWVAFLIVPAFALANAGVAVGVDSVALLLQPVGLGIVLGLVVGKPLGILSFSWLAVRARVAELPPGVTWGTMAGIASLAGIGFTMALFIGNLAFVDPTVLEQAKIAILFASVVSAGLARVFFQAARKAAAAPDATAGAAPATPGPVPEEEMDEAA